VVAAAAGGWLFSPLLYAEKASAVGPLTADGACTLHPGILILQLLLLLSSSLSLLLLVPVSVLVSPGTEDPSLLLLLKLCQLQSSVTHSSTPGSKSITTSPLSGDLGGTSGDTGDTFRRPRIPLVGSKAGAGSL
jgi:hypothetical protein